MVKDSLLLEAKIRDEKVKAQAVRAAKKIPAVFYGKDVGPLNLEVDYKEFRKVFLSAGESTIIDLKAGDKTYKVLIHDVQLDPIKDTVSHVDFLNISMDKEIEADIPFVFIGVSPAVKELSGTLSTQKQTLRIKCLPKDLPHSIEVDISSLAVFHDSIHIKDLVLPPNVKVLDNLSLTVATVVPPRKEEEEAKPVPTAAEVTGVVPPAGAEGAVAGAPDAAAPVEQETGKKKEK